MTNDLHATIAGALETDLFDHGITADSELDEIFERIRKTFAPEMPRPQFELKIADIVHDAEEALAGYVRLNADQTADAVIDALAENDSNKD